MGPIQYSQNSSAKSENRPCTRSAEAGAIPQPTNLDLNGNGHDSNEVTNVKQSLRNSNNSSSNLKRPRPSSPTKRSKARKSLDFGSDPVPQPTKPSVPVPTQYDETFDLVQMYEESISNKVLKLDSNGSNSDSNSFNYNPPEATSNEFKPNDSSSSFLPNDLAASSSSGHAQNTRRSQRLTLKRLEEGQSELKVVEAGPGPSVTFNIPLFCSKPSSGDQHSDYGTASESSFNSVIAGKSDKDNQSSSIFVNPGRNGSKIHKYIKKRHKVERKKNSRSSSSPALPSTALGISPGYLSDTEDNDDYVYLSDDLGFLDSDTPSNSQPWDDDVEIDRIQNITIATVIKEQCEWDQIEIAESSQNSVLSNSSAFLNISNLVSAAANVEFITYHNIYLIIPLEGYVLPPIVAEIRLSRRSQLMQHHNPFENGSRLCKRRKRLLGLGRSISPFSVQTFSNIDVESSFRKNGLKIFVTSPVILLEPFGTTFSPLLPVIVSIPLDTIPSPGDEVYCLYSNKTSSPGNRPSDFDFDWKLLHGGVGNNKITYENGRITFETTKFCYFLIIIREKCYEAKKHIRGRIGGKLYFPYIDGVEVNFPRGSIKEDITASAKIYFDTEMSVTDYFESQHSLDLTTLALASPILMIEPHGLQFFPSKDSNGRDQEGIKIQLPIPNYDYIMKNFNNPKLTIWQSCTRENEPCKWDILDVPFNITKIRSGAQDETVLISFQVEHFSFFRIVWDILSTSLYEAKVGMSYLSSHISFSMLCQAYMEENTETNRFGLEVICYRSDKTPSELTSYRHRVGNCNKPKLVKPGKIVIRLKSHFFEADVDAGEDGDGMVKEDADFRGRDFEKQYALRFKKDKTVGRGTFGKVIVKRSVRPGNDEAIFEFNLNKYGCEGEKTPSDHDDRWAILALQELAGSMFITADDNWKILAKEIGFTKKEIKTNLKYASDPYRSMLGLYKQRGGSPDEFVNALYSVSRQLKLGGETSPTGSKKSVSSQGSSGLGSSGGRYGGSDSDTSGTQISQDSLLNGSARKRSNPSINRSEGSSSKSKPKRMKLFVKPKLPKRSLPNINDSGEESDESGESDISGGVDDDNRDDVGGKALSDSTSIYHRNDLTKLEGTYLWDVSAHIDNLNWRNLARTLCLDEASIFNIEHLYKAHGFRECAYQMLLLWKEKYPKKCAYGILYSALCKEGMNAVAKKMKFVTRNE